MQGEEDAAAERNKEKTMFALIICQFVEKS